MLIFYSKPNFRGLKVLQAVNSRYPSLIWTKAFPFVTFNQLILTKFISSFIQSIAIAYQWTNTWCIIKYNVLVVSFLSHGKLLFLLVLGCLSGRFIISRFTARAVELFHLFFLNRIELISLKAEIYFLFCFHRKLYRLL